MDRAYALRIVEDLLMEALARSDNAPDVREVMAALRSPQEEAGGEHRDMVIYADLVAKNLTAEIEGHPRDSHHDRLRYARSRAEQVRDYLAALARSPGGTEPVALTGRVRVRHCGPGRVGEFSLTVEPSHEAWREINAALDAGELRGTLTLAAPAGAESSPKATDQGAQHGNR